MIALRKPSVSDVPAMIALMAPHMRAERLLPRTPRQVVERLREYWVARRGDEIVGVASLGLIDFDLAEVGALAGTDPAVEAQLLDAVLDEARDLGVQRAFVLTHDPRFFQQVGFERSSLDNLPQKRDHQCAHCPRVAYCRQVALEIALEPAMAAAAK